MARQTAVGRKIRNAPGFLDQWRVEKWWTEKQRASGQEPENRDPRWKKHLKTYSNPFLCRNVYLQEFFRGALIGILSSGRKPRLINNKTRPPLSVPKPDHSPDIAGNPVARLTQSPLGRYWPIIANSG